MDSQEKRAAEEMMKEVGARLAERARAAGDGVRFVLIVYEARTGGAFSYASNTKLADTIRAVKTLLQKLRQQ